MIAHSPSIQPVATEADREDERTRLVLAACYRLLLSLADDSPNVSSDSVQALPTGHQGEDNVEHP
jgi:hypothetical protein